MSVFSSLFGKKKSGNIAKKRLMMMLEYERASTKIDNVDEMKQDIINVIKKYVKVKDVNVSLPIRCQYLFKYMIDPRLSNIQPVCVYMEVLPGFNPIALDLNEDFIKKIDKEILPKLIENKKENRKVLDAEYSILNKENMD